MNFEQALQEMRKGYKVSFKDRYCPLTIVKGQICECFLDIFEPLDSINTCNIMREDWEIVQTKPYDPYQNFLEREGIEDDNVL